MLASWSLARTERSVNRSYRSVTFEVSPTSGILWFGERSVVSRPIVERVLSVLTFGHIDAECADRGLVRETPCRPRGCTARRPWSWDPMGGSQIGSRIS